MTKEELLTKKISAISLGCDKNRVDLEHLLSSLSEYGFSLTQNPEDAEIIIVNTCAFIQPAIIEAIENIEYALSLKQTAKAEKIIVSGCLPMRDIEGIAKNYQGKVDAFLGLKNNKDITSVIEKLYDVMPTKFIFDPTNRVITNGGAYAYLKIAEGCSNGCAYCTIPRIRGRFTSVPLKELVIEAKKLASKGYKELILVAQDTARYGEDLLEKPTLIDLLDELSKIKGIEWIRLQYIYPEWLTLTLLDYIKKNPKVCKYLDMPLQHIDDDILKAMNRKTGEDKSRELVNLIHYSYPEITLRSTFIVGLPGETKKKFNKLCEFIADGKITYASFFSYFREDMTKAYYMPHQVWNFVKKRRLKKVEEIQNVVLNHINSQKIGQTEKVLIDEFDDQQKIFIGHTQNNSPNVDLCVIIDAENLNGKCIKVGDFYEVKLTEMIDLGFKGEIYDTKSSNND